MLSDDSLFTIIFVYILLYDLYYNMYLYNSHVSSLSLYSSLVDDPYSGSTFFLGWTVMLFTWGSITLHDDHSPRDLYNMVTCLKRKNQVIEGGIYFDSHLESTVYHENEVPAEKLDTTSQVTSLVMKHREMKTSSLLTFCFSPSLCLRYMKWCSSQLKCVHISSHLGSHSLASRWLSPDPVEPRINKNHPSAQSWCFLIDFAYSHSTNTNSSTNMLICFIYPSQKSNT